MCRRAATRSPAIVCSPALAARSLSNLNGGNGVGTLGTLDITDRSGVGTTVDLSGALSVDDVINEINTAAASAHVGITASLNSAGNGIQLTDTSGSTAHNLIVADGDSTTTAENLGIAVNAASKQRQQRRFASANRQREYHAGLVQRRRRRRPAARLKSPARAANRRRSTSTARSTPIGDLINAINATNIGVKARSIPPATGSNWSTRPTAPARCKSPPAARRPRPICTSPAARRRPRSAASRRKSSTARRRKPSQYQPPTRCKR